MSEKREKEEQKEEKVGKPILKYLYYVILIIVGYYQKSQISNIEVILGDTGTVVQLLFAGISNVSVRWAPYMGFVGVLITTQEENLKDIQGVYMIATIVITATGILLKQFI